MSTEKMEVEETEGKLEFPEPAFPPIGEPEPEEVAEVAKPAVDYEEIRREIASLRETYAEQMRRNQDIIDKLIQSKATARDEEPKQPSFDDLPDPVEKPEEFKRALSHKFEQALSHRDQQQNVEAERAKALNNVWTRFQGEHPDLAKRTALVQGATALESNELRKSGIDPADYIQSNPDGFISRVVKRMRDELGGEPQPMDIGRTVGVSSGTTLQTSKKSVSKEPGFIQQLKAKQAADGLY